MLIYLDLYQYDNVITMTFNHDIQNINTHKLLFIVIISLECTGYWVMHGHHFTCKHKGKFYYTLFSSFSISCIYTFGLWQFSCIWHQTGSLRQNTFMNQLPFMKILTFMYLLGMGGGIGCRGAVVLPLSYICELGG